ncbi:hypothetical protein JRI60_12605 [Archangium violaceum]|uniref:hypothetical protein n=1 Tax=Archangium violaceum TaxID=83451 RepID=UPI00195093DD|nr:hypothetical protein [Archangium violaceum]QRN99800.1 hypothetical protein JRI60_12605 [Archangium violaceum]
MTLPKTKTLLANVVCLLVLAWLYGGDLSDALRARSAEVSAFLALPPLVWPAVVLAVTTGALGVVVWGVLRGRGEDFKGYRLLPIVLVGALFLDLVLVESQVPLRSEDVAVLSLRHLQEQAQALSNGRTVPSNPEVLRRLVADMGQPPYLVRGARAPSWSLQVRSNCQGPVREAPGLTVGTFIYCVAPGDAHAWITLVGLPAGERFGLPAVVSEDGEPHVGIVQPTPPEEGEESEPFREPPGTPAADVAPESTDAGEVAPAPNP